MQYFINHLAYYIVHAFPMMLNYTCIDILTERDVLWAPRNKRPEKLRDVLKEVEASFTIMYEYHFYCDNIYVYTMANFDFIKIVSVHETNEIKIIID